MEVSIVSDFLICRQNCLEVSGQHLKILDHELFEATKLQV